MASLAANAAESKKALETVVLETGKVSYLADYFVICSGESTAQLKAISEAVTSHLEKNGAELIGAERDRSGKWFLLDYGDVIIHILNRQEREFYQLEQFWNHANVIARGRWVQEERQAS
jgi:ribosome-associated protein